MHISYTLNGLYKTLSVCVPRKEMLFCFLAIAKVDVLHIKYNTT